MATVLLHAEVVSDYMLLQVFFLLLIIIYTNLGVLLFQPVSLSFSDYWNGMMAVTGSLAGSPINYKEFEHTMPFWGGAYMLLLSAGGHGLLLALVMKFV